MPFDEAYHVHLFLAQLHSGAVSGRHFYFEKSTCNKELFNLTNPGAFDSSKSSIYIYVRTSYSILCKARYAIIYVDMKNMAGKCYSFSANFKF